MLKPIFSLTCLSMISLSLFNAAPAVLAAQLDEMQQQMITTTSVKQITDEYIVIFTADALDTTIDSTLQRINLAHQAGVKPLHRFSLLKGFAGKIPTPRLEKLTRDADVHYIEANQTMTLALASDGGSSNVESWGLDRIDQAQLPLDNVYSPEGSGIGVHAYIIDSGIRTTHYDFAGRASWDFTASDINDGNDDGNDRRRFLLLELAPPCNSPRGLRSTELRRPASA